MVGSSREAEDRADPDRAIDSASARDIPAHRSKMSYRRSEEFAVHGTVIVVSLLLALAIFFIGSMLVLNAHA
jgi:hypothetical protein